MKREIPHLPPQERKVYDTEKARQYRHIAWLRKVLI